MNSLEQLNTLGTTTLDVTDNRPSKVIFDRVTPLQPFNQTAQITSTTVAVVPGIEIVEIINYTTANVRFRVRIVTGGSPLLTGSTVFWSPLPTGLVITQVGDEYTITGINTIAHWDAVKNFTWSLPANYATRPLWYLDVAVVYYDSKLDEDVVVDWEVYDPDNYYIAQLNSAFTINSTIGYIKKVTASLSSQATLDLPGSKIKQFTISMTSTASIEVSGEDLDLARATITAAVTQSTLIGVRRRAAASMSSTVTASITVTQIQIVTNLTARSYLSNTGNAIFLSPNTPSIETTDPTATFRIELSSSLGQFGTGNAQGGGSSTVGTFSYQGTAAEVNAYFSSIYFWPDKAQSGTGTFTYKQYRNTVLQTTRSIVLANVGDYGVPTQIYTYSTAGSGFSFTPTFRQAKYALADYLIVGGGGAGSYAGGGGGGGDVSLELNQSLLAQQYNITVGAGGVISGLTGYAGQQSTFGGAVASGGSAGAVSGGAGGDSLGNGTNYYGGAAVVGSYGGGNDSRGSGGGAGAAANGSAGSVLLTTAYTYSNTPVTRYQGRGGNGGTGVSSTITGATAYYGSGGGGGGSNGDFGPVVTNLIHLGTNGPGTYGRGGVGRSTFTLATGPSTSATSTGGFSAGFQGIVIVKLHA